MRTSRVRRSLIAGCTLLAWLGFVSTGAHALFSADATLQGNAITTGTANLLVSNSQAMSSTTFETSRLGFNSALAPGEVTQKYFFLKNSSSAPIPLKLFLRAKNVAVSADAPGMPQMTNIYLKQMNDDGTAPDVQSQAVSLERLRSEAVPLEMLAPAGKTVRYQLFTGLDAAFGVQSASVQYDLVFQGLQQV